MKLELTITCKPGYELSLEDNQLLLYKLDDKGKIEEGITLMMFGIPKDPRGAMEYSLSRPDGAFEIKVKEVKQ